MNIWRDIARDAAGYAFGGALMTPIMASPLWAGVSGWGEAIPLCAGIAITLAGVNAAKILAVDWLDERAAPQPVQAYIVSPKQPDCHDPDCAPHIAFVRFDNDTALVRDFQRKDEALAWMRENAPEE